jgi:hypothetical protein
MCGCSWCDYNISNVYFNFNGYMVFDYNGIPDIHVRFCSINCCIAYIESLKHEADWQIYRRVDYLYDNYKLIGFINESKNPKLLKKNGGNLSYPEFRKGFICPVPDYTSYDLFYKKEKIFEEEKQDEYYSDDEDYQYNMEERYQDSEEENQ